MTPNKGKTLKAILVMEQMGVPSSRTTPVLKKLLKVCENSWEHIEADKYSLLAAAIFEADTPQETEKDNKKRGDAQERELQSARTKQRRGQEDPPLTSPMAKEVQSPEERRQTSCQSQDISTVSEDHQIIVDCNRKGDAIEKCREPSKESATISLCEPPSDSDDPAHDTDDICKGEERVNIPVVNDFPGERCPTDFTYISQSIVHRNASLDFSLSQLDDEGCCSDCFGNCLDAPLPCVCARETGGVFAYTLGGLLKTEFLDESIALRRNPSESSKVYCKDCPLERDKDGGCPKECKGHLPRKFIKECWKKCGCHKQCDNRVVQQGLWCNLQVFWTPDKGWGLRTTCDLPKGAFLCEYVGEVMTCVEFYERTANIGGNLRHTYPIILDANWASEKSIKKENALCLDGTFYGNIARFINHQCFDANLVDIPIEIETTDRHFYHVAFFTTRKIDAYEELTWDYGINFDKDEHLVKVFPCQCDSIRCRDKSRLAGRR